MSKGKLIVIDGVDGSGKATQTELLVKNFRKAGKKVVDLDFPQYETFFGKMVAAFLRGEFGQINPQVASVLFAANRMEFGPKIKQWLKEGKVVILNRYTTSNQIHQVARLDHKKEKQELVEWIAEMEYKIMGLPKPDLVIFLRVPAEISYQLIEKKDAKTRKYIKGEKRDILESDLDHQKRALKEIEFLLKSKYRSVVIDCTEKGQLLSKAAVADKVWAVVKK